MSTQNQLAVGRSLCSNIFSFVCLTVSVYSSDFTEYLFFYFFSPISKKWQKYLSMSYKLSWSQNSMTRSSERFIHHFTLFVTLSCFSHSVRSNSLSNQEVSPLSISTILSTTWMTPFVAGISMLITFDPSIFRRSVIQI